MCHILRLCHWRTDGNIVVYFVRDKCSSNLNVLLRREDCMIICDGDIPDGGRWTTPRLMMVIYIVKVHFRVWNLERLVVMTHMIILALRYTDILFRMNKGFIFLFRETNFLTFNAVNFGLFEILAKMSMQALTKAIAETRLEINLSMRFVFDLISAGENAFLGVDRNLSLFFLTPVEFFLFLFIRLHIWIR